MGDCGGSEPGLIDRAPGEVAADRKALGTSVRVCVRGLSPAQLH